MAYPVEVLFETPVPSEPLGQLNLPCARSSHLVRRNQMALTVTRPAVPGRYDCSNGCDAALTTVQVILRRFILQ